MHPTLYRGHFLLRTMVYGEYCPIISHARGSTRVRLVQWVRGPVVFVRVAAEQPQACIRPGPGNCSRKESFAMVARKKHANAAKTTPFASTALDCPHDGFFPY